MSLWSISAGVCLVGVYSGGQAGNKSRAFCNFLKASRLLIEAEEFSYKMHNILQMIPNYTYKL